MKGKARSAREIGAELQAEYILEGSVMRAGQQLRINVRLIRVRDEFPLWSGKFDRELKDVFVIQDEISRGIVNNLRLKLGQGRRRYETSTDAYDVYLRARTAGWRESVALFELAIAQDPSFAPAYAGLAAAYAFRTGTLYFDREDELARMRAAAEKAIQLDPLLAEAHASLGIAYARDGQWKQSEQSFRRAIELNVNRSATYDYFALYLLLPLGRIDEAVRYVRLTEKLDPRASNAFSFTLLAAEKYDEAANACEKFATEPGKSTCVGRARLGQGRIPDAIAHSGISRLRIWQGGPPRGGGENCRPGFAAIPSSARVCRVGG